VLSDFSKTLQDRRYKHKAKPCATVAIFVTQKAQKSQKEAGAAAYGLNDK